MCDMLMDSICRLCLKDNFTLVNIYSSGTPFGEPVFRVLNEIYDLKISKEDRFPSKICVPCLWRMYEFDTYKKNVKYAESELGKLLSRTSFNTDEVSNEEPNDNVVFWRKGDANGMETITDNDASDHPDARVSVKETEVSMKQEIDIFEWTMPEEIQPEKDILDMSIGKSNGHKNAECDVLEEEMEVPIKDEIVIVEWEMPNELQSKTDIDKEHCSERCLSLEEGINSIDNELEVSEVNSVCHEINTSVCVRDTEECSEMVENGKSVDSKSENKDENEEVLQEDVSNDGIKEEEFESLILESSDNLSESGTSRSVTPVKRKKKALVCDVCKKSFDYKSYLGRHVRVHNNERPFKCNKCGKGFKQDSVRREHELLHLREGNGKNKDGIVSKAHSCDFCGKQFKSKRGLLGHSNLHKNKYKCRFCGRILCSNSDLNRHLMVHTNEKPFSCKICKMSFSRKDILKEHMTTHSEDRHFQCNVCHKRFKSQHNKSYHELIHLRSN